MAKRIGSGLAEYQQQALTTITEDGRALTHEYLVPAIIGEIGELFGQRAKAVWHGWDDRTLREELVAEYGDVCWMVAVLLHVHGHNSIGDDAVATVNHRWASKVNPWAALLTRAESIHLMYAEDRLDLIPGLAEKLWAALEARCEAITHAPIEEVLQYNLDKLASRAAREALKGKGDHR